MSKKMVFCLCILLSIFSFSVFAAIPRTIFYQGKLLDKASNLPVTETKDITFTIYRSSDGSSLWSQKISITPDSNGNISQIIGPIPASVDFSSAYEIGLNVDGEEMSARQQLTAAPYALRAMVADSLASGGSKTAGMGVMSGTAADYATLSGTSSNCVGAARTSNYAALSGTSSSCTGSVSYASLSGTSSRCTGSVSYASLSGTSSRCTGSVSYAILSGTASTCSGPVPYATLSGTASNCSGISGTANYISKFTAAKTLGNSIIYDNGTNVGIGKTGPGAKLDIGGLAENAQGLRVINTNKQDIFLVPLLSGWGYNHLSNAGDAGIFYESTGLVIGPWENAYKGIRIDSSGNVGIGAPTPGAKLDVIGSVRIADGTQGANRVLISDANGLASWKALSSISGAGMGVMAGTTADYAALSGYSSMCTGTAKTATYALLSGTASNCIGPVRYSALSGVASACSGNANTANTANTANVAIAAKYSVMSAVSSMCVGTANLTSIKVTAGTPGAGKVLTSDQYGNATWQTSSKVSGMGIMSGTFADYATMSGISSNCTGTAKTATYSLLSGTASNCVGSVNTAKYAALSGVASVCTGAVNMANTANIAKYSAMSAVSSMCVGTANLSSLRVTGGTPGAGKVLVSDANGLATWQTPAGGSQLTVRGRTSRLAKFADGLDMNASSNTIEYSSIYEHNGLVGIGCNPGVMTYTVLNVLGSSELIGDVRVDGQVTITGGAPGAGKVLISDANGLATWQPPIVTTTATASVTAITSAYTVLPTDSIILCTANYFTITLPSAVGLKGKMYTFKRVYGNNAPGPISIVTTGQQMIDGAGSYSLNNNNFVVIVSDGANWQIISKG